MARLERAVKSIEAIGKLKVRNWLACSQIRTFVPPSGTEYGLEKKWAYYNQAAIDNYAARVGILNPLLLSFNIVTDSMSLHQAEGM